MNVDISAEQLRAGKVWFDASTGRLCVEAAGFVNGIEFSRIPEGDFESVTPVSSFAVGHQGATIICRHKDGKETWLPINLWQPGGCTPTSA